MAINWLEHGCVNLPDDVDQDTLTDACFSATDGILPNPHRLPHASSAASVMDLRHADRDAPTRLPPDGHQATFAPVFPRPPTDGHYVSRGNAPGYHKLDFPTFDGQEDPLSWLNRRDQFFHSQHTLVDKVWLATFHMIGPAQLWYH